VCEREHRLEPASTSQRIPTSTDSSCHPTPLARALPLPYRMPTTIPTHRECCPPSASWSSGVGRSARTTTRPASPRRR
jgi:hypothetical protein